MPPIDQDVLDLLKNDQALGIVATSDELGNPLAVVSPFLGVDDRGRLVHLELLETSPTNRNLLHTLWFNRTVSVTLRTSKGRSFLIKGRPVRCLISGPVFTTHYLRVRSLIGDADLAAVWIIQPEEAREETYDVRKKLEEAHHPFFVHLDRLAV